MGHSDGDLTDSDFEEDPDFIEIPDRNDALSVAELSTSDSAISNDDDSSRQVMSNADTSNQQCIGGTKVISFGGKTLVTLPVSASSMNLPTTFPSQNIQQPSTVQPLSGQSALKFLGLPNASSSVKNGPVNTVNPSSAPPRNGERIIMFGGQRLITKTINPPVSSASSQSQSSNQGLQTGHINRPLTSQTLGTPNIVAREIPSTSINNHVMANRTENLEGSLRFVQSVNTDGQVIINVTMQNQTGTSNMVGSRTITSSSPVNGRVVPNRSPENLARSVKVQRQYAPIPLTHIGNGIRPISQAVRNSANLNQRKRVIYRILRTPEGNQKISKMLTSIIPSTNGINGINTNRTDNMLPHLSQHSDNFTIDRSSPTPFPSTSEYREVSQIPRTNGVRQILTIDGTIQTVKVNRTNSTNGMNGMRQPTGINGKRQPTRNTGMRPSVGMNGMRQPAVINEVRQPAQMNRMRQPAEMNSMIPSTKINEGTPRGNGMRLPVSTHPGTQTNFQINFGHYRIPEQTPTSNQLTGGSNETKTYKQSNRSLPNLLEDCDRLFTSPNDERQELMDPNKTGPSGSNTTRYIVDSLGVKLREAAKRFIDEKEHDYASQPKRPRLMLEEMEHEVDLGVAETYSTYMPSKLKIGKKHPDPVVETASLSSVAPVDVWYKLSLPQKIIGDGILSALQLESITYASQAHAQMLPNGQRAGFLIGDGAGVGKGRTIAGIILENYLKGRKRAVWVSVSNDLSVDAERDLRDIGADFISVHLLSKMKYSRKIVSAANGHKKKGVLFCTYSSLIGESHLNEGKYSNRREQILQWCRKDFEGLLIFDECHKAKNLCPNGSMKSTKTGQIVLDLQKFLPKARVLYASATGASEPKNMAYMARLGLWGKGTTFKSFDEFVAAVEEKGVGGMEIVAMDMKLRGMYIARQLSFQDVSFTIREVELSEDYKRMYNMCVKLWVEALETFTDAASLVDSQAPERKTMWGQFWSAHQRFFKYLCIAAKVETAVELARDALREGCCVVIGLQSTGEANTLDQLEKGDGELSDFVSTAKGVFENLVERHFPSTNRDVINKIIANYSANNKPKSEPDEKEIKSREWMGKRQRALLNGDKNNCDSDGNLRFFDDDDDDEDCDSDDSNSSEKIRIRKQKEWEENQENANHMLSIIFPSKFDKELSKMIAEEEKKNGKAKKGTTEENLEKAKKLKEKLLEKIRSLREILPKNTLDELISSLGGPEKVAEMTGRKGRVVQTANGVQYESRNEKDVPLETLNIKERQRFMNGEKLVAIISEAASSGISLQSDRRAINTRKRYHITLELPWSADKAVQQFGRTHRSNQVCPPKYIFLITNLAGERRFASTVAKRLESLGALTHGDRRASNNKDLSQFNIDNKYGKAALEQTMKAIVSKQPFPGVPEPGPLFFKNAATALTGVGLIYNDITKERGLSLDKDYTNLTKFLNRMLGVTVGMQAKLFDYFTDTMNAIIEDAKKNGTFDLGILDLGANDRNTIKLLKTSTFLYKHATGIAPIELHRLSVEGGMSWNDAKKKFQEKSEEDEGFYVSFEGSWEKHYVILLIAMENCDSETCKKGKKYTLYRPNTGKQSKSVLLSDIIKKYGKATPEEVQYLWEEQFKSTVCSHLYWSQPCPNGQDCENGIRRKIYHVLAGSVLPIWQKIEKAIEDKKKWSKSKMQVIRLKTIDDKKVVGTVIKNHLVDELVKVLLEEAEDIKETNFCQGN